jgi:hypothetical protein
LATLAAVFACCLWAAARGLVRPPPACQVDTRVIACRSRHAAQQIVSVLVLKPIFSELRSPSAWPQYACECTNGLFGAELDIHLCHRCCTLPMHLTPRCSIQKAISTPRACMSAAACCRIRLSRESRGIASDIDLAACVNSITVPLSAILANTLWMPAHVASACTVSMKRCSN